MLVQPNLLSLFCEYFWCLKIYIYFQATKSWSLPSYLMQTLRMCIQLLLINIFTNNLTWKHIVLYCTCQWSALYSCLHLGTARACPHTALRSYWDTPSTNFLLALGMLWERGEGLLFTPPHPANTGISNSLQEHCQLWHRDQWFSAGALAPLGGKPECTGHCAGLNREYLGYRSEADCALPAGY